MGNDAALTQLFRGYIRAQQSPTEITFDRNIKSILINCYLQNNLIGKTQEKRKKYFNEGDKSSFQDV